MLAGRIHRMIGSPPVLAVRTWDGDRAGPPDAAATLVVRSPDAVSRVVGRPGELGVARAWVAGDLDLEGDLFVGLGALEDSLAEGIDPRDVVALVRAVGVGSVKRLAPPPEEAHLRGPLHSLRRDRAAVTYHYDVSNEFYRLLLGPSLTYSCAVFAAGEDTTLEDAQAAKYELICRKLALEPGQRLLDVGCGWGGMLLHAAEHHGAVGVGITLSEAQAELARERVADRQLDGKIEIRVQDYREIHDGPFDAVASIGMFEHVGRAGGPAYARNLAALVRPGGRVLNHAISRPGIVFPETPWGRARAGARRLRTVLGSSVESRIDSTFFTRYVFPDGELLEVGATASLLSDAGLEVRHVESLREHYALTLRRWVANLEDRWDEAVELVGEGRARVWRLYLAVSALGFERNRTGIHQILAVRPADGGRSAFPLTSAY